MKIGTGAGNMVQSYHLAELRDVRMDIRLEQALNALAAQYELTALTRDAKTISENYRLRTGAGKRLLTRVSATAADSLRSLRGKYPGVFLLVDGYDYPAANAKNCAAAFDRLGHGAVVCSGSGIVCAWKQQEDGEANYLAHIVAAAERMKKNLTRYVTIL